MCGLSGYIGPGAEQRRDTVTRMLETLAHRGPDDHGLWIGHEAILGHRRLSIIDPSAHGHQPMHSPDGRYVLVYNGEIYNYRELRAELEALGATFHGDSDSEVLLAAFLQWGEACVEHFNGMWAFAIHDRHARRLFLSRDRFGEKPLYYVRDGERLWFASEIKALLAAGVAHREVNPRALADFALDRVSDHTEETFFANVYQLPPASRGWFEAGQLRLTRYWALPLTRAADMEEPSVERIHELLQDSVRLRLRSDVPVGVLLSGGLDSSSVACLAAVGHESLAAFSTIDHQPPAEAQGIEHVLAANPALARHVDTPADDILTTDLDTCLWHQEEPFADGSMLAHFRLMRMARQHGIRVLLTGQAADEVFAGYPGFQALHIGGLLRRGRLAPALGHVRCMRATAQHITWRSALGYALPAWLARPLRRATARTDTDWIAPAWRAAARAGGGYADLGKDPVNTALGQCLRQRTLPAFLHYEDRNAMAFGVETRIPFLDHRLVEAVLPVPATRKLNGGRTKALLRDAMAPAVPAPIVQRLAKEGYPAPLARWLRNGTQATQTRHRDLVAASPLVDCDAWQRHADRFYAGDNTRLNTVWRGLIVAAWHERFIGSAA